LKSRLQTTRALKWSKLTASLVVVTGGLVFMPAMAAGAASVSSGPVGELLATLQDPGASAHDDFGDSVSVSGQTAVVGSPGNESDFHGAAYIYQKGSSGWSSTSSVTLSDPNHTTGDNFGDAGAICKTTLVVSGLTVGGSLGDEGVVYIYTKGTSGWPSEPAVTLVDPDQNWGGRFGYSVACSGTTVVVGMTIPPLAGHLE
jgi:FG-GAP repeat